MFPDQQLTGFSINLSGILDKAAFIEWFSARGYGFLQKSALCPGELLKITKSEKPAANLN